MRGAIVRQVLLDTAAGHGDRDGVRPVVGPEQRSHEAGDAAETDEARFDLVEALAEERPALEEQRSERRRARSVHVKHRQGPEAGSDTDARASAVGGRRHSGYRRQHDVRQGACIGRGCRIALVAIHRLEQGRTHPGQAACGDHPLEEHQKARVVPVLDTIVRDE
jgi:hypothetical protein